MAATLEERKILVYLIENNIISQNPILDLGNCGLDGTEKELQLLEKCTHLETLIFSDMWWNFISKKSISRNKGKKNIITKVPIILPFLKEIILTGDPWNPWKIENIDILVGFNKLKSLHIGYHRSVNTNFIKSLSNLELLDIRVNDIVDINFLKDLNYLKQLNLKSNKIEDISVIQYLTQIEILLLDGNKIKDVNLSNLTRLKQIFLQANPLEKLVLKDMPEIESIDLSRQLQLQKTEIHNLPSLKKLNLGERSSNKPNDVNISNLPSLEDINLVRSCFKSVSFLYKLKESNSIIQGFDLSYNLTINDSEVKKLQQMTTLKWLKWDSHEIENDSFLSNLAKLTQLELLSLHGPMGSGRYTYIQNITPISFLKELIFLDLSCNKISNITPLIELKNLTELTIYINQITDVSPLRHLKNLIKLNISNNQITDVSPLRHLKSLIKLDLSKNQITDISFFVIDCLPKLQELKLSENPIQNIPKEIFDKNENVLEPVRNFLQDAEKGKNENKEVKIIFIGNGSVGKTQIAKRLCDQEKFIFDSQHNSTHAIALLRRELASFELNCWDFAGQDLYHATHRLFMQTRALFVLVWDWENENNETHTWKGKEYQNEKLEYWLEYARCFAPKSPILILQNKIDEFADDFYFEYKKKLKQKYPILDFLRVSAKSGKGFMVLEDTLTTIFTENNVFKTSDLPTNWIAVRNLIREKQKNGTQKTLSFEEFTTLCQENNCEKSTPTILAYLHDTGVLYYKEGYFQNQIILNQDWAIQAIYKVLDRESDYFEVLEKQIGRLLYKNIVKIWANNTDAERELFVDFMLSAELAFETTENKKYDTPLQERSFIIPQLLSLAKDNDILTWEHNYLSKKIYSTEKKYSFLPKVFIQRFIIKANHFSEVHLMWQKGLALQTQEGYALVEACYEKGNQKISIKATNSFLIQKIEEELNNISQESKVKAGEAYITEKDKFGLAALKPIIENKTNFIMNKILKEQFQEAVSSQIPNLLDLVKMQYDKIPSHQRGKFNRLKDEFSDQPNNFRLSDWQDRMVVWLGDLDFEVLPFDSQKKNNRSEIEIQGINEVIEILIERKNFFLKEKAIASDTGIKFSLQKQIEQIEQEIKDLRNEN